MNSSRARQIRAASKDSEFGAAKQETELAAMGGAGEDPSSSSSLSPPPPRIRSGPFSHRSYSEATLHSGQMAENFSEDIPKRWECSTVREWVFCGDPCGGGQAGGGSLHYSGFAEGELFAVDSVNNNIVRITPPLSQYSRGRLVAGSFQGYSGHVDGKPSDARFKHPKGVTMDDKGNVYVADTANLAIQKNSRAGVTTIAGGKSNVAGYRDGPSEDAKFSTDFDVVYMRKTCSLLVIDRGNAALRQISLQQEDCDYQYSSIAPSDMTMVIGAVLAGYVSCLLQQGLGLQFSARNK
uniref:NHL repeat-containing protein 2 n=1 Tax=Ananas comosus var. bracteatus TaxID=296719 RepID=A0A6V7QHG4_ANACO|nr:unnamed protein product [Ananas comosus var. bracteatus]